MGHAPIRHEIIPILDHDYMVNGARYRCVGVSNNSQLDMGEGRSEPFGTFVHMRKVKRDGSVAKTVAVRFYNCRNDPSWFDQDVAEV